MRPAGSGASPKALEYGIVGNNEVIISTEIAPVGSMKEAASDREGSKYRIEEFLEVGVPVFALGTPTKQSI